LPTRHRKSVLAIFGLLAVALTGLNHMSMPDATASPPLTLSDAYAVGRTAAVTVAPEPKPIVAAAPSRLIGARRETAEQLARRDPWALARLGRQRYEREVRDYTCVFLKQERIGGELGDVQEIEVRYREDPMTVYMIWTRNADQVKRALFEETADFVNDEGEKVARVEPAGVLIRLIVSDILMPIHGQRARQSSRRSIDEFGFRATFELLDHFNQLGADYGVLDLHYDGEGEIDGRPTYRIVRYLPYDGPGGTWPDAKMVMHLDQEWLLPTAVYSYADREGKVLLGSYVHTRVRLNPGLNDNTFKF
jgi:hypothetical protein